MAELHHQISNLQMMYGGANKVGCNELEVSSITTEANNEVWFYIKIGDPEEPLKPQWINQDNVKTSQMEASKAAPN